MYGDHRNLYVPTPPFPTPRSSDLLRREDNRAAYSDAIAAYGPEVVGAYVDPVFRLSKWLLAQGRTIRGVGVVLGAAEALHDFQRPIIEAAFPGSRAYN